MLYNDRDVALVRAMAASNDHDGYSMTDGIVKLIKRIVRK
ncbi:hypothetical protein G1C96_1222 [Bifidobacterium sp. DSM 109958]|uniref:Uncharacterized protein n=1 Tax=Bifidobacterium moraviense TaxID=2675323 RepID=A0A7Y0F283_9BIFI|nr:hypothetical protein [Bifidobacterium sp. DSM 109958]